MDPKYWWDILRHQQTSAVIRHVFDEKIIGSVSSAKQFITALVKRRAVINQLLYKYIHNYIYTDAGENNLRQTDFSQPWVMHTKQSHECVNYIYVTAQTFCHFGVVAVDEHVSAGSRLRWSC